MVVENSGVFLVKVMKGIKGLVVFTVGLADVVKGVDLGISWGLIGMVADVAVFDDSAWVSTYKGLN